MDENQEGYYQFGDVRKEKYGNQRFLVSEQYINTDLKRDTKTLNLFPDYCQYKIEFNSPALTRPSFWSRRDVSQAYFKFKVNKHSIDSLRIKLDFGGAVDLSPIGKDVPHLVSGNSITYVLNRNNNASVEIPFYVKFKDLENSQSRRIFLLTAIISALITIFIAFIIIFIFRFFSLYSEVVRETKNKILTQKKNGTTPNDN